METGLASEKGQGLGSSRTREVGQVGCRRDPEQSWVSGRGSQR
jgi:hypothetical protein